MQVGDTVRLSAAGKAIHSRPTHDRMGKIIKRDLTYHLIDSEIRIWAVKWEGRKKLQNNSEKYLELVDDGLA